VAEDVWRSRRWTFPVSRRLGRRGQFCSVRSGVSQISAYRPIVCILLTSLPLWKEWDMFYICLFVCRVRKIAQKVWADFGEIFGGAGRGAKNNGLDFSGDQNHEPDPGLFTYYCDSYKQPRIKRENPRRWFGLSACFLVRLFVNINKSVTARTYWVQIFVQFVNVIVHFSIWQNMLKVEMFVIVLYNA